MPTRSFLKGDVPFAQRQCYNVKLISRLEILRVFGNMSEGDADAPLLLTNFSRVLLLCANSKSFVVGEVSIKNEI
jgi:hypothetical protein